MDGVGMNVNEKYFPGGYDPEHPTGNVQYRVEDNLDGTGIYYEYDVDGTILVQEELDDLDIPEPPTVDVNEMFASLSPQELQRVMLLGIAITHPESVWALEYAVVAEDPLVGIEVVRNAALTALEISEVEDG